MCRRLFAATKAAPHRHYDAGRFSFNVIKGRCETCAGEGFVMVELLFLPSVYAPCPTCHGARYNAKTLEITYRDKNIADVLGMTVDAAWEFFTDEPQLSRALGVVREVGLGYLRLGQPATELSGGEAQRIKLATELQRVQHGDTFYVLDEPTTGLHPADVEKLLTQLDGLVQSGNTVIVVEHEMRVVAGSDWVIDMGPGAGEEGGAVVAAGTPADVSRRRQAGPRPIRRGSSTMARRRRELPSNDRPWTAGPKQLEHFLPLDPPSRGPPMNAKQPGRANQTNGLKFLPGITVLAVVGLSFQASWALDDKVQAATLPLWSGKIPGPVSSDPKNVPTLTIVLPEPAKANGTAVVVCPGGGYSGRAVGHEGKDIAAWLNQRGVAAFILKYRTAGESKIKPPLEPGPMLDVQQALRTVRARAAEYKIDSKRIGVWGFSAGGHLASTAATHFDEGMPDASDPIARQSCRPDFAILSYPVITMGPSTHGGSKNNLLGPNPDPKLVEFYSNEKQVTDKTPPTFLFHTVEDKAVPIANSRLFKAACEKHGVPVELVEYEKGSHGVGLGLKSNLPLADWSNRLEAWLKGRHLLGQ